MEENIKQELGNSELANDPGGITFKCPSCNEAGIQRSAHDRKTAARYRCPKCGFEGPN